MNVDIFYGWCFAIVGIVGALMWIFHYLESDISVIMILVCYLAMNQHWILSKLNGEE